MTMVPPEYEHAPKGWGEFCAEDDRHTRWYVLEAPDKLETWPADVRKRVVRRSLAERTVDEIEDVVDEWAEGDADQLAERFEELASTWRAETKGVPFLITRAAHWAYQRIIGMGPDAIPLILEDLAREPDHWYWALNAITGEDPAEGVENFDEAAERWLDWGKANGYIG